MTKKRNTQKPEIAATKEVPPPVDISDLVKHTQLRYLRLCKSDCTLFTIPKSPPALNQTIVIEAGPSGVDPNAICVQAIFTLDGRDALHIEAIFEIMYECDASVEASPEQKAAFGHLVGVNNAWPYWREFIQSMTTRMGLPSLTLPLLRVDASSLAGVKRKKKKTVSTKKKTRVARKKK